MSDIGEARQAAAQARSAYDRAQMAADSANHSRRYFAFAVKQWELSHTYEDREPLPIIEGNARYDIPMPPPPTDAEVKQLEKAAAAAEKKLDKATKALDDAAALSPPRREPSPTGWSAVKSFRFAGTQYDPGDPFDPSIAEPGKLNQIIGARLIAATSPAGATRAS